MSGLGLFFFLCSFYPPLFAWLTLGVKINAVSDTRATGLLYHGTSPDCRHVDGQVQDGRGRGLPHQEAEEEDPGEEV